MVITRVRPGSNLRFSENSKSFQGAKITPNICFWPQGNTSACFRPWKFWPISRNNYQKSCFSWFFQKNRHSMLAQTSAIPILVLKWPVTWSLSDISRTFFRSDPLGSYGQKTNFVENLKFSGNLSVTFNKVNLIKIYYYHLKEHKKLRLKQ